MLVIVSNTLFCVICNSFGQITQRLQIKINLTHLLRIKLYEILDNAVIIQNETM